MPWLKPEDGPDVVYEFFAPFAHVEGRYEWCRIRSPTHGVFDVFIVLNPEGTQRPAVVYVNDEAGKSFMADRYPACKTIQLPGEALVLAERERGRVVQGRMESRQGPVRKAEMTFTADADETPTNVAYGGTGSAIWGNEALTCWGVDLVLRAEVSGEIHHESGEIEAFAGDDALVTLGSFGRIARRQA
jgi:hypothetical protein